MPSCCCGWLRTAAGSRVEALSHVGQVRRGPCEVWLVSQSRHRSQLQASQSVSSPARREGPAWPAGDWASLFRRFHMPFPFGPVFACMHVPVPFAGGRRCGSDMYLACAALRYQYIIQGGVPAMAPSRGHPWECSPVQGRLSAPSLSTALAAAHSCFFVFFPSLLISYLLSSLAVAFYLSIGFSSPADFTFSSKAY